MASASGTQERGRSAKMIFVLSRPYAKPTSTSGATQGWTKNRLAAAFYLELSMFYTRAESAKQ